MSEPSSSASHDPTPPLAYAARHSSAPFSMLRVGGSLGIAACSIGLLLFVVGCFGMNVFKWLPIIPLLMSVPGLVLSILGATVCKAPGDEDTHVMAGMFVTVLGLIGAVVELSVGHNWTLFFSSAAAT